MAGNFGGEFFWRIGGLRAIRQYFIRQKLHSVMSSLLQDHSLCTRPAARRASLIVGMEFTFESCVRGHCFSEEFCTSKERVRLSVKCQREEGGPNDVYTITVKTDGPKKVQSKRNNDFFRFELHLILDFVLRFCPKWAETSSRPS